MSFWKTLLKKIAIAGAHVALEDPKIQAKLEGVAGGKFATPIGAALQSADEHLPKGQP